MTEPFGHGRLIVYQKGMRFVALRRNLLDRLTRRVSACDHLERAAESIQVNIAHGSSTTSAQERMMYLGHANGSALECAACLDVLAAKHLIAAGDTLPGKLLLAEIVSILLAMHKTAAGRVREPSARYHTRKGNLFDHEDLDVYQLSLKLTGWLDPILTRLSCSTDLRMKLDRSTTSIVLNIAEGNGRFTAADKAKYYKTARKTAIHSDALLDLAAGGESADTKEGREWLHRVAAMLAALTKTTIRK